MGELGITIDDLDVCPDCGHNNSMMFQGKKDKWYIACGYRKCGHKTKLHKELLDACDEWGLRASE
jgi:hypothetical protein